MTKGQKGLWICLGGLTVIGGALLALRHEEKRGTKEEVANRKEVDKMNASPKDSTPKEEEITVPLPEEKVVTKKEVNIQPTSKDMTEDKKDDVLNAKEEKGITEDNPSEKEEVPTSTEE